jgi:predicted PurR-regulated permease PerM
MMDKTTRTSALFLAAAVGIAGLYYARDVLAPFALAVFLWLMIDGFAHGLQRIARIGKVSLLPGPLALAVAGLAVVADSAAIVAVVADTAADFAQRGPDYARRIDEVMAELGALVGIAEPPTLGELLRGLDIGAFLGAISTAIRGIAADALFVGIYVAFLFAAQATFPKKLDALFPDAEDRARARLVVGAIRGSLERYLAVQTLGAALSASLAFGVMTLLGLDNALFWAFLIFLFNYIPTIGSIVGTALPVLFSLVQFDSLVEPAVLLATLTAIEFTLGNFLMPRLQGANLNLTTIVVLLGLALWGAIWGIPGMFLSSPLTVMLMIVLAQFPSTRWIAVLLSADGRPEASLRPAAR